MPVIELSTHIAASRHAVFDLSRSVDLHVESTARTNEKAVAGRTGGLIGLGEEVTWEATHFGVRQRLTTRIVEYDPPRHFRDSMVAGAFRRFDHDHHFDNDGPHTLMRDTFDYTSPFGIIGHVADLLFLKTYMRKLLQVRNQLIKSVAESRDADRFIGCG